jgi:hypothetical protein
MEEEIVVAEEEEQQSRYSGGESSRGGGRASGVAGGAGALRSRTMGGMATGELPTTQRALEAVEAVFDN